MQFSYGRLCLLILLINHGSYTLYSSSIGRELNSPSSVRRKIQTVNHDACLPNVKDKSADCSSRKLTDVPQDLNPDIEKLKLQHNDISSLWNKSFQKYSQLTELFLQANSISWIQEGSFYPLVNLRKLDLSVNLLRSFCLPRDIFQRLCNVQELDRMGYDLTSLVFPGGVNQLRVDNTEVDRKSSKSPPLCSQHQLEYINLSANEFFTTLNPKTLAIDCKVNAIFFEFIQIQTVDPDTIASLHTKRLVFRDYPLSFQVIKNITLGVSRSTIIERLAVQYSNITCVPDDLFEHLRNKTLASLSLAGSRIELKQGIFKDLTHVVSLDLLHCGFKTLDPRYFDGMAGLRVLRASSQLITSMNPDNIAWGVNLDELFLGLYQCTKINKYAFRGLHDLTKLFLTFHNEGDKYKNESLVVNQAKLQNFHLESETVWRPVLRLNAPNLKTFHYRCGSGDYYLPDSNSWELSKVAKSIEKVTVNAGLFATELFDIDTSRALFSDMPKLIYLDLSENKLVDLLPALFKNLSSLTSLDLSHNEMKTIAPNAFIQLVSLETLNLSDNVLFFLPDEFAINLKSLQNLHLDSGELRYVGNESLHPATGLTTLILANNRFLEFNRSSLHPFHPSLKSIDISGNNVACNCKMKWLIEEFGKMLINEAATICSTRSDTLEPLRGKPITTLKVTKYCSLPIRLYLGVAAAVFSLLVLSVAVVISFHYRWFLGYKIFLAKLAILGYREIQDGREREEFEYDINVMFFDGDEEWAANNLLPEMDGRLQNFGRIAFGDNQLILGMHYFDAVYYNVENSFKTILLLSRAAVQDHIFMTKFRIAMNHVTDTKTENMILVFLEDIPDQELPHLVRLHLSGQGAYLTWEEDEEGQEYFWKTFIKNLNSNLRVNHMIPPD